ncbi:MAG TPA: hypothetical protein VFI61_00230 [Patescibacteria group bacterium]|nr:hypothetical protein [Patescibacteria group bacterium]
MKYLKVYTALLIIVLLSVFFILKNGSILSFNDSNLDYFAKKITQICSKDDYKRGCYDREIPKILSKGFVTMEQAFAVTSKIQQADKSYLYCHVLGHELADIETRKDTSKWLDVIARCPALACNNGCAHGAVMRRFKGSDVLSDTQLKEILPDLNIACEPRGNWKPSELEISMCYHSMGHLGMYITDADINKSISLCKSIAVKADGRDYYQTCMQGVFMIIFQSLDEDDASLVAKIKPTKETVASFCSKYSGLEYVACKVESMAYFSEEIKNPSGLVNFCKFAKGEYYRDWCYDAGLRGRVSLNLLDTLGVNGVANYCLALPSGMDERCFASVANGWIQDEPHFIKDSIALCEVGEKYGFSDSCYKGLLFFSKFSFNKGSEGWNAYCNNFPLNYKTKCLSGEVPSNW